MPKINDTIVAPATNISTQAIALIRISGDQAFEIINKITKKTIPYKKGIFLRQIFDNCKLLDEVVINAYTNPSSFTGEDVIEIACHGGILNTNQIIKLILKSGARMALQGEFSQRAFLNGKIDLLQAEGINDLINATNELALKIGADNMSGKHNQALVKIKANLLDIISRIQTSIDYPDYDDIEGSTLPELIALLKTIKNEITSLLRRSKMANKSIAGIKTVIVGKTNVGKSSLLNRFLSEEKAIVTDIPGTTRDIVEGQIALGGVNLNLIDTAGIRKTNNFVETLGIKKTRTYLQKAELVLFVVTNEEIEDLQNQELFKLVEKKPFILVINKADQLNEKQKKSLLQKYPNLVFTSALNDDIEQLIDKIQKKYQSEELIASDALILINTNQISLIEQVHTKIEIALVNLESGYPIDIINVDLYSAWDLLNQLIGEQCDDEIIDNIFRKYCLGK